MEAETTLPAGEPQDNLEDDEEDGEFVLYGRIFYNDLAPLVKKFLIEYFGERIYTLESETYREVEDIIKKRFERDGDTIITLLYDNTTIPDKAEWKEAFYKFEGNTLPVVWPPDTRQWLYEPFRNYDDDDDDFLDDIPESELTETQKSAKEIVEMIDNGMVFNDGLHKFLNAGCVFLIRKIQKYLAETIPFFLLTLSPEGFGLLQVRIENTSNFLLEDLFEVLFEP